MTKIKAVSPFIYPAQGKTPARRVPTDEALAPGSDIARAALDLGALRDADARAVAAAHKVAWPPQAAPVAPAAAVAPAPEGAGEAAKPTPSGGRK